MSHRTTPTAAASGTDLRSVATAAVATARAILKGETETTSTQRNALVAFAVRLLSAGLLYLSQIVLARWMGGFEYGLYVFVWTWVLVLGGISHLGLNLAMIRLLPQYRETGELELLRGLLRGGRLVAVILGTVVAGLGLAGLWLFGQHLDNHYVLPLYLAFVCVPMFALTDAQDGLGRSQGWMAVGLVPPYVLRPLLLLVAMTIAHAAGLPMVATTAAGAAIVATWLAAMVQTLAMNRKLAGIVPAGPRKYAFGAWLRISSPMLMIVAADLVLQNTDIHRRNAFDGGCGPDEVQGSSLD